MPSDTRPAKPCPSCWYSACIQKGGTMTPNGCAYLQLTAPHDTPPADPPRDEVMEALKAVEEHVAYAKGLGDRLHVPTFLRIHAGLLTRLRHAYCWTGERSSYTFFHDHGNDCPARTVSDDTRDLIAEAEAGEYESSCPTFDEVVSGNLADENRALRTELERLRGMEEAGKALAEVPDGWTLSSADFSLVASRRTHDPKGHVALTRDPKGRAAWLALSEEEQERVDLYVYGYGRTLPEAFADACKNALSAATLGGDE